MPLYSRIICWQQIIDMEYDEAMFFGLIKKKTPQSTGLTVKYGPEIDMGILRQVYALDVLVYEEELQGVFENLRVRFEYNRDTFICVMDGGRLAGYINFFPVGDELHKELFDPDCTVIRDDDIMPEEMAQYVAGKVNNLFIISVVVHPDYRNGEAVKLIGNSFKKFIREKHNAGCTIGDISGAAVSDGGRRFLSRLHFVPCKKLDDGYDLYVCAGEDLEELIKDGK